MENNKKTITANEINKFCYCPYQWYYERYYGRNELRRLSREKHEEIGTNNNTESNFDRGNKHHDKIYLLYKLKITIIKILVVAAMILAIYVIVKVNSGV